MTKAAHGTEVLRNDPFADYASVSLEALIVAHLTACAADLQAGQRKPLRRFFAARSMHLAFITALTAAVAGGSSIGAFPPKLREAWLHFFDYQRQGRAETPTGDFVMKHSELLAQATEAAGGGWFSEPLQLTSADREGLDRLTYLRDRMEHPRPETNLISPGLIGQSIAAGLRLTEGCLKVLPAWMDEVDGEEACAAIESIREQCALLSDQP